jgi:hypothetical protein
MGLLRDKEKTIEIPLNLSPGNSTDLKWKFLGSDHL